MQILKKNLFNIPQPLNNTKAEVQANFRVSYNNLE